MIAPLSLRSLLRNGALLGALPLAVAASTGCWTFENIVLDDAVVVDEVTKEEAGEARFDIGEINEDCSDEDPTDSVFYSQRTDDDGTMYCLIAMDWEKLLISMAEIREGVEQEVEDTAPEGVSSDGVKVEFTDVSVNELNIALVKEGENGEEETLGFDQVVYYLASINLAETSGLVQIDWPVPGSSATAENPRTQLLGGDGVGAADESAVVDFLNQAYVDEEDVHGQGHAELEFQYAGPEELAALSGSTLKVGFKVSITGEGSYSVSRGLNPGEDG